jgi:formylglycine-generating enzyme required for sulfatase activity
MEFVLIQPGTFQMGADDGNSDTKPVHTVHIGQAFYLGKHEVTQEQWQAMIGNNPSRYKGDSLPVENVSWHDAQEFLRRLNAREGGQAVYRLPTEAEWEYAARAGSTARYSFGNSTKELGRYAWYNGNAGNTTHAVGTLQPNVWGLYDMHGNVSEWVQDCYDNSYDGAPSDGRAWEIDNCTWRVARGGSFVYPHEVLHSAVRVRVEPEVRFLDIGFRCVRVPPLP